MPGARDRAFLFGSRTSVKRFRRARFLATAGGIFWLAVLGCRTTEFMAQAAPTPTRTAARATVRPTFTRVPPTRPPSPTLVIVPTSPPKAPTRTPTRRPPATARPAVVVQPTPAPPPTADPYQGYYFKVESNTCTTAPNTRIEGTVTVNGALQDGIRVRVSHAHGSGPSVDDSITGTDPRDHKHYAPEFHGKYRLGLFEGQQNAGNWWVFVVNSNGDPLSPGAFVNTHDGPGCNTATVNFAH